jgi:AFG3 family protein
MIDEEVRFLVEKTYKRTLALLTTRKMELEKLAKELLEKEVLFQSDVEALIGKRPYGEKKPVHIIEDVPEELLHHAKSAEEIAVETSQNGQQGSFSNSGEALPEKSRR